MITLTAQHAVSPAIANVSEDMHLRDLEPSAGNYEAYAVFSELDSSSSPNNFLGLVPQSIALQYPLRIFADLVPSLRTVSVHQHTPLDQVLTQFNQNRVETLTVIDVDAHFCGGITRRSHVETLLTHHQRIVETLQREVEERRQVEQELNARLQQQITDTSELHSRYQLRLKNLGSALTYTEQRERQRLALELHDYLAQLLIVSRLKLGEARPFAQNSPLEKILHNMDSVLQAAITYTRSLTAELNPTVLMHAGLIAALHWLREHMSHNGLQVEIQTDAQDYDLAKTQETLIYQTIRDLLFNVLKHAEVKHATVRLKKEEDDQLRVTVSDAGRGFDPTRFLLEESTPTKLGLTSIRERLQTVQASMDIESAPEHGTTITLLIPRP